MSTKKDLIYLVIKLIKQPSITPHDYGCQKIIAQELTVLDFQCQSLDRNSTKNIFALHGKPTQPLFLFSGHTDVVPTGPLEAWQHPPFEGYTDDVMIHGRGAQDMKGNLAAMIIATQNFLKACPSPNFSIGFAITSDEEGSGEDGMIYLVDEFKKKDIRSRWTLVGEPTSEKNIGDVYKIGRRGSINLNLTFTGKQGHVAYLHSADNIIHRVASWLHELETIHWPKHPDFPAVSLHTTQFSSSSGASNVVPSELSLHLNIRNHPNCLFELIEKTIHDLCQKHRLNVYQTLISHATPFIHPPEQLAEALKKATEKICGISAQASTSGGTSDARYLTEISEELIEFGCCNSRIHQVNECVEINEIFKASLVYQEILHTINQQCF